MKEFEKLEDYNEEKEYCLKCNTELGSLETNPMEDAVVINEKIKERNMENNYIRFTPSNNFILKKVETRCLEDKWKSTHVSTKITGLCKNCNTEKEIIYDDRDISGY